MPEMVFTTMTRPELPRTWFISADDSVLIQLQADRLLLNWRRGATNAEYPHFETVSGRFRAIYQQFEAFVADAELGTIQPEFCEMTYVNQFRPKDADGGLPNVRDILRLWPEPFGQEWNVRADAVRFQADYRMLPVNGESPGRLTASLNVANMQSIPSQVLQFELAARGRPLGDGFNGVIAFHERARENIVRYFAAVTTETAQNEWHRIP